MAIFYFQRMASFSQEDLEKAKEVISILGLGVASTPTSVGKPRFQSMSPLALSN